MANRVVTPNLFAPNPPNWSLAQLDANATNAASAINDSSLGAVNGPLSDTGSVNAYSVTCSYGSPSAYNNGMTVFFNPGNTNTGASTLTVSPLASLPIVSVSGAALSGGELIAGSTVGVVCDGSAFRIVSAPGQITSVRLRSFNALGNSSMECDQKLSGASASLGTGSFITSGIDRWTVVKTSSTATVTVQQIAPGNVLVPGTNFTISRAALRITLTATQATLAATDRLDIRQAVEGPQLRELISDVNSVSVLVRSSVAGLKFGFVLNDSAAAYTLPKLCTIASANTWTLITLPNLPIWTASGTFPLTPGNLGYSFGLSLAAGSTLSPSANDTWQTGNFLGANGQSNFFNSPVNSTVDFAFCQHEPGSQCTTLIDCPFGVNYDGPMGCMRYFQKTYEYENGIATPTYVGSKSFSVPGATTVAFGPVSFPKILAKAPTITFYNPVTGAINSLRDSNGTDHGSPSAAYGSKSGFAYISFATATSGAAGLHAHFTVDTGW